MKILCVIDNFNTGGAQRQIVNLAVGLHRRSHQVSMFCYTPGTLLANPLEKEGIHVHFQPKKSKFSFDVIQNLRRYINQGEYQAVISFLNTPNFYTVLSSLLSKSRPATIVSERFCDIPGYPNAIELAVRHFYRLSRAVVVNSHHQRMNFIRRYPWMKDRVVTVYNGYDLHEFIPPAHEPENAQIKILVVASVSKYKNGLCLVRALDILRREYNLLPRVNWVGRRIRQGNHRDYLSQMEEEIDRSNIPGQWQWLDQRTDVIALLQQHDVLVHPSYGEGLPNVVCEAMACGRPVIVSDTLDHPQLVRNGVNGFLFDWQEPADLARKIKEFSDSSREERHRMGEKGRCFAEKYLSLERFISDFEQIISQAIE